MSRAARNSFGIFLIVLGIIGSLLPIIPGFVFFIAAVGVLGSDHAIVVWGRKWLVHFRILKPEQAEKLGGTPAGEVKPSGSQNADRPKSAV